MSELVTHGVWRVRPGQEAEFIAAWTEFATWASAMPGSPAFRLTCDDGDPQRYVSFAPWADAASVRAWKQSPQFRQRIAQILQHVEDFQPTELSVVAGVEATLGAATH